MLEAACLVTVLMLFTLFLVRGQSCGDKLVGSAADLNAKFRINKRNMKIKIGVVLPDILIKNVVTETIEKLIALDLLIYVLLINCLRNCL